MADKPGSVVEQSFIWDVRHRTPRATYPGTVRTTPMFPYLVLLQMGFTMPCLLPAMRCALTAPFHPYPTTREWSGGIFSVALSVGLRPPGVTWHRVLWSPDFPPRQDKLTGATAWPTPGYNITDFDRAGPVRNSESGSCHSTQKCAHT